MAVTQCHVTLKTNNIKNIINALILHAGVLLVLLIDQKIRNNDQFLKIS